MLITVAASLSTAALSTMAMAAARLRLGSLLPRARALCAEAKPTYTERMDATGRPVSPHLMIYRLPTIAYSSITVRISGIIAGAGVLGAGVVLGRWR